MLALQSAVTLFWILTLVNVCWAILAASAFRAIGLPVTEVNLFSGKPFRQLRVGGTLWNIGSVPMPFANMRVPGMRDDDPPEDRDWRTLSYPVRIGATLSPWLTLFLVFGALVLGPARAVSVFGHSFAQLMWGAFEPISVAKPIVLRYLVLQQTQVGIAVGVMAVKVVAFNLLPLPGSAGWQAYVSPFVKRGTKREEQATCAVLFVVCLFFASWLVAIVAAFYSLAMR